MIGASKILTVSYGTFSCTLEGFDDSFGTMKAIAEYFRDLASDDRYFGAEPPTPDAEMLAKIAGREIKRQVEAKVEDHGVTLRPLEQGAEAVAPVAAPVIAPIEQAPAPVFQEPEVELAPIVEEAAEAVVSPSNEYDDTQDEASAEVAAPAAPTEGDTESVAAKLRRIRAVVAQNQTAGVAAPIFSQDQSSEDFLPDAPMPEDMIEEAVEVTAVEDIVVEETDVEDTTDDADISAMMSRVSDEAADVVEHDVADRGADHVNEDDAEIIEDEEYEAEDDALSNILDAVAKDEAEVAATSDPDDVLSAEDVSVEIVTEEAAVEEIAEVEDAVEDAAKEADVVVIVEETVEVTDIEIAIEEAAEVADVEAMPQQPVKPVRPTRARIIKVKKTDLIIEADAGDARYSDDIIADSAPQEDQPATLGKTNLSAEDEAELLAELADVEQVAPTDTDAGINTALRVERTNHALRDQGGAEDEAAVSRLLDETNTQLDTKESTRRRSAISHLRAAVAATAADRKFNEDNNIETPDEVDPYRNDLADVMRPQHVTAKGDSKANRPAPLILVSEQRIDSETSSEPQHAQIRPRRIRKNDVTLHEVETGTHQGLADLAAASDGGESAEDKDANIFADSTSFADFAEKMGATELPDLLEVAAAYTAYVEGRPSFARPQIMRQVAGFAGKDEFNREEGLRSFGQLLRQGKIIKLGRGKFEIAETTRFKPEARYAGE